MNSRSLGSALGIASVLALLTLGGGEALAATTTIGQLAPDPSTAVYHEGYIVGPYSYPPYTTYEYSPPAATCNVAQDYLQASASSGSAYVVPANGEKITAWRTDASSGSGQQMTLKVFRKVGEPASYEVVAHDGPRTLTAPASANEKGRVNAFTGLSIPVQPGDLVGLYPDNATSVPDACMFSGGGSYMTSATNLADSGSSAFTGASGSRLNLTADVLLAQGAGPVQHTLTVSTAGTGAGTVQSAPAGIEACSSTCSQAFDEGTTVTLSPSPGAYSSFAGWSGACSGQGACQVTIGADAAVTATFNVAAAGGSTYGSEYGYGPGSYGNSGNGEAAGGNPGAAHPKCKKKPRRSSKKADKPRCAAKKTRVLAKRAHNAALGEEVLTAGNGHTLYSLSAESGSSFICTGPCVSIWHPLTVPAGIRPLGPVKLGTVKRPEGSLQVTFRGMPLYTFAEDSAPGDAHGQGIKDVGTWAAVVVPPPAH